MNAKDLTREPPRSPRVRIRDYVILARAIDKCRAELACTAGDYHYDCPLDRLLFLFKGIASEDLRRAVAQGESDDAIGIWLDEHGVPKTPEEVRAWSDATEAYSLFRNRSKRDDFVAQCEQLGLDPAKATMFDWLEADDEASFRNISRVQRTAFVPPSLL